MLLAHGNIISTMVCSGIKATKSYSFLSKELLFFSFFFFFVEHYQKNLVVQIMLGSLGEIVIIFCKQKEKKLWKLVMGKVLLIILKKNRVKIQCFFYLVQVDQDNRIANFF